MLPRASPISGSGMDLPKLWKVPHKIAGYRYLSSGRSGRVRGVRMPIETKTVLTCGHCGADKAEANGWYLLTFRWQEISIRSVLDEFKPPCHRDEPMTRIDVACGCECAMRMVSKALGSWKHVDR